MASSQKTIDCSICKLQFDEDHGVWVCLECTEKLTNAIHQASSTSPHPNPHPHSHPHPPHRHHSASPHTHTSSLQHFTEERRSSLPSKLSSSTSTEQNFAMTLFLELTNNANKRRFKYKPNDLHKNGKLIEIKEYLIRRFTHDVDLKKLSISSQCEFEINDRVYQHQFFKFESLSDLFDGCKIKINLNQYYFQKYNKNKTTSTTKNKNKMNINAVRRRSKSASNITDDMYVEEEQKKQNFDVKSKLKIHTNTQLRRQNDDTIISPMVYATNSTYNTSFNYINDNDNKATGTTVIIDNGSGLMKCGFGCNLSQHTAVNAPNIVFPTAYFKQNNSIQIGDAAVLMCEKLKVEQSWPIRRGFITDWNEMEYIWNDVLNNKLKVDGNPLLMTERYGTPVKVRERVLEIMFERFEIASLYLCHSAGLSVYGTGRTKGIVLDVGHGVTSVVSVTEHADSNVECNKVIEYGGYDLTIDLMKEYKLQSYLYSSANRIKEEFYSVPYERSDILFADQNNEIYKLPDGKQIALGKNRMIKPLHLMFDKSINQKYGGLNVSQLVTNCVKLNDKNIQHLLWKNIVLSGGTTMMNGFAEKFAHEIKHLTPSKTQVIAGRSRRYLSWLGAVVMSSISTFKNISISRAMYKEHGPRIVREMKL